LYLELKTGKEIKEGLIAEKVKVQAEEQKKAVMSRHDMKMAEWRYTR
jgi:hypothetical protein